MPLEVVFTGPRQVELREYAEPALGPREVRVAVLYSGISHGTERSHYRGDAVWHHRRVEPDGFVTDGRSMGYPFTYGYEDVARVIEVGPAVHEVSVGDVVLCWAHHRETQVFDLDRINRSTDTIFLPLPAANDMERYIFVSLGTVALDAYLVSGLRLGESAVVIGQGVVGLLQLQLCKLAGAEPVIAVDLLDERLELARRLGADHTLNPRDGDAGVAVRKLLGGRGADLCFECSGRTAGIGLALHCGTPFPKVIAVGMYDGPASDLYLGEEFCRSAGQIIHSRSGGYRLGPECPTAGLTHRKWDVMRVNRTIIRLLQTGRLDVRGLISHRFPLSGAVQAYELVDRQPASVVKVIFDLTGPLPSSAVPA